MPTPARTGVIPKSRAFTSGARDLACTPPHTMPICFHVIRAGSLRRLKNAAVRDDAISQCAPPFASQLLWVAHPIRLLRSAQSLRAGSSPVLGRVGTTNACTMCFWVAQGFRPCDSNCALSQVARLRWGFRQRAQLLASPERVSEANESNGPANRLNFSC